MKIDRLMQVLLFVIALALWSYLLVVFVHHNEPDYDSDFSAMRSAIQDAASDNQSNIAELGKRIDGLETSMILRCGR